MQFFLVDVICISSATPRETFDEIQLEKLADAILQSDGLLRPLILKATRPERFEVLDGHLEYWAAVRAREKNPRKGEMVNAFVISPKEQETILKQLYTLQDFSASGVSCAEKTRETMPFSPEIIPQEITRALSPLQHEMRDIQREVAAIRALPDQLNAMVQQLETRLQACFEQWAAGTTTSPAKPQPAFSLDEIPEPLTGDYLAVLTWDQIKMIAKARGIKIKGGRVMIEKQLLEHHS